MSASPTPPPTGAAWRARLPNLLTILRLLLAAAFIGALSFHRFPDVHPWAVPLAAALFIVAAATDALDGYLARRWNVVSLFGRVMDPFADKVLVLGAFVVLAGPSFVSPDSGRVVTGVAPWMAALILARELLVTSIRGAYEARGVAFPAGLSGKLKMMLQSGVVPIILILLSLPPASALEQGWRRWTIDSLVWLTVLVTLLSAWPYISRAVATSAEARRGSS